MADPISILTTCGLILNQIQSFLERIHDDDNEIVKLLRRAVALKEPLRLLQSLNSGTIYSKYDILRGALLTLEEVDQLRAEYDVQIRDIMILGDVKEYLKELKTRISEVFIELQTGIIVDDDLAQSVRRLNNMQAILLDQIETLKSSQSSSTEMKVALESLYVNEPPIFNFNDRRSILGSGSFGITYRKKNQIDHMLYAVKVIECKIRTNSSIQSVTDDSLVYEAELLQELNHPNIVRYFVSFYSDNHTLFNIVMELVNGGSLLSQIILPTSSSSSSPSPSPPIHTLKKWLIQILRALQYMHEDMNILHRDIKPQNILLTEYTQNIKLIDLGVATFASLSMNSTIIGTQLYASYEKAYGLKYDGRDDIWGVGCIWSELMTRTVMSQRGLFNLEMQPICAERRQVVIQECITIDSELGHVVEKMLVPVSENRYTASQCLDLLTGKDFDIKIKAYPHKDVQITEAVATRSLKSSETVLVHSDELASTTHESINNEPFVYSERGGYYCSSTFMAHTSAIFVLALTHDDSKLVSGGYDHIVYVWDMLHGSCLYMLRGHREGILSLAITKDDKQIFSGSYDQTIRIWDIYTGECLRIIRGHNWYVSCIVLINDDKQLITGSATITRIWDIESGKCTRTILGHNECILSLVTTSDGKRLLSGSEDPHLRIWNIESGECEHMLMGHTDTIDSVCLSKDDTTIVSGSQDRQIRVWTLSTYECIRIMEGHEKAIKTVALSYDDSLIISGSEDNSIRIWGLDTGECLHSISEHTWFVSIVASTHHSRTFVSGSFDKSIHVWSLDAK